MPVRQGTDESPLSFYWSIPPVTRTFVSILVVTKLASALTILPIQYLYMSWQLVVGRLEVWRLFTSFLVFPAPGFVFLLHMVWTVQYGKILEGQTFANRTPDFLWMLIVGGSAMLVLTLVPFLRTYFLASSLTEMLLYVWSRHYPTSQVSIMGLVNVQALYLPFTYVALAVVMGSDWRPSVVGILAGHLYYYLTTIYPATSGRTLIVTPEWLKRLMLQYGIGQVNVRDVPSVRNPAAPGFRPFSGAGRRLS